MTTPSPTSGRPGSPKKPHPCSAATPPPPQFEARKKIQPRTISGLFTWWRWAMVWATQLFFYGVPWLQWGDRQSLLFDLQTMRFYLFGLVLYPQDFIYLAVLLIICALALFLITMQACRCGLRLIPVPPICTGSSMLHRCMPARQGCHGGLWQPPLSKRGAGAQ